MEKVLKFRDMPASYHDLWSWHINYLVEAAKHTGEVRYYSQEEIAQYELETQTIKEKHNERIS